MERGIQSGSAPQSELHEPAHYECSLYRKSVPFVLSLRERRLTWTRTESSPHQASGKSECTKDRRSIDIRHVLGACVEGTKRNNTLRHTKGKDTDQGKLIVHFVEQLPKQKLKVKNITFDGSLNICRHCADIVHSHLAFYEPNRPKNLLVFINPRSGRKSGEKTFYRKVAPLFTVSGIDTKVVVTERKNHSREFLQTTDLNNVDGIICVGGDGTLSEVANGYLQRCYNDDRIDFHKPETVLPRPRIPIGIIPTGSGDTIARFVHETRSVTTAAIHVILGRTRGLDFGSVHYDHQLLCYTCLLVGYGLYGRLIQAIETRRWLPGKIRYSVIPLVELLKVRSFQIKVEMLMPCDDQGVSSEDKCVTVGGSDDSKISSTHQPAVRYEWREYEGPLLGVDSFIVQLMPLETSMRPYIGNGLAQLTLVRNCPRLQHLRHLVKLMERSTGFYDYDFIEEYWVSGYRVQAVRSSQDDEIKEMYLMNCDGDLIKLDQPRFEVRVHKELIKLFTWSGEDWPDWSKRSQIK